MKSGLDQYLLKKKIDRLESENSDLKQTISDLRSELDQFLNSPEYQKDIDIAKKYFESIRNNKLTPDIEKDMNDAWGKYSNDPVIRLIYSMMG